MADLLVGLVLGLVGLVVCLMGLRVFFFALPALGFVAGFFAGAAGIRAILGESFLSSLTGIIVGVAAGLVLAALSYLFWYVGALLSAGSTGALIGSALMHAIGVNSGWIVFTGAAIGGILVFLLALMLALPVYVVVVNTAFVGASGAIAGLLLIINQIDRVDLGYGLAWATIEESWLWLIAWVILAAVGLMAQLQSISAVQLPGDRWEPASPGGTSATVT